MGFREGAFATIWEITSQGDKSSKVRMSINRKDKRTDEYVTDFSGFVSLIGEAHKKLGMVDDALTQENRCRVKLGPCDVSNRYDADAKREYTNFTLFDFEIPGDRQSDEQAPARKSTSKKSNPPAARKTSSAPPLLDDGADNTDDLPF